MLLNKTKFADMQEVKYRKLLLMRPAYILTFFYYPRYILMWFPDLGFSPGCFAGCNEVREPFILNR